jgi:hypothetical protein
MYTCTHIYIYIYIYECTSINGFWTNLKGKKRTNKPTHHQQHMAVVVHNNHMTSRCVERKCNTNDVFSVQLYTIQKIYGIYGRYVRYMDESISLFNAIPTVPSFPFAKYYTMTISTNAYCARLKYLLS